MKQLWETLTRSKRPLTLMCIVWLFVNLFFVNGLVCHLLFTPDCSTLYPDPPSFYLPELLVLQQNDRIWASKSHIFYFYPFFPPQMQLTGLSVHTYCVNVIKIFKTAKFTSEKVIHLSKWVAFILAQKYPGCEICLQDLQVFVCFFQCFSFVLFCILKLNCMCRNKRVLQVSTSTFASLKPQIRHSMRSISEDLWVPATRRW